jgi:exosome complex component RRP42
MEISELTKKRIIEYLGEGKRFDDRGLNDYRKITIETGISKNAEGSARVVIGRTEVLAGVKMNMGTPYTDSPDAGTMMVSAEFSPMASQKFEMGPPKIDSIELARIVDRGIRESGFIDFKKLCVKEGEAVWTIFIDIFPINHDGNLVDASALAAIAALKTAVFPEFDKETNKVHYGEFSTKKLPLADENTPLTMTFYKIGSKIIMDPVIEEEESQDARISIAISKPKKKEVFINAMQKGGEKPLTDEDIDGMLEIAPKVWDKLNDLMVECVEHADKKKKK